MWLLENVTLNEWSVAAACVIFVSDSTAPGSHTVGAKFVTATPMSSPQSMRRSEQPWEPDRHRAKSLTSRFTLPATLGWGWEGRESGAEQEGSFKALIGVR